MSQSITILPFKEDPTIAQIILDLPNEKVNKLSTPMMLRLTEVLKELAMSSYLGAVIYSAKNNIFIAGADIEEIKNLNTEPAFDTAVRQGQDIFNMIEDLKIPVIAAIHGACAGGGCELSLACDYRVASDDSSTRIGLPETKLGIIPGFGGCVRLPRVVGLPEALDIILQGKLVSPSKALRIGLVDKVVHKNNLLATALKLAQNSKGKKRVAHARLKGPAKILHLPGFRNIIFSKAKEGVLKATHGHYPAPLKAIDVIAETYGSSDREKSLTVERKKFIECALTPISKNLIHVFYLTEMVKKQTGVQSDVKPKAIHHLGILGAGTMGGGVAYVAADKGIKVRMKDIQWDAIGRGLKAAYDLWYKLVKRKVITQSQLQQKMALVTGTVDYSGFKLLDLTVEAIVEDLNIKKKVIAEVAGQMRPDAIMVTNTSSLSVNDMAVAHPNPALFAGMHFFNPVHKMPLVEVIRGKSTSDETVATVFDLAKRIGKMPVVVQDGPGFLVNRLLVPYLIESSFMLQEGMAIDLVDTAFVKQFGMPMGPFELMDEIGLDVCLKVAKIFQTSFGERIEMPKSFGALIESKRLGKKNGRGFYKYINGQRQGVDLDVYRDLDLGAPKNPHNIEICLQRGIYCMINECALALLKDKIVQSPAEVDLAMIMGTGFPPFRGGLLKYADSIGSATIVERLNLIGIRRLTPSEPLLQMARQQKSFY